MAKKSSAAIFSRPIEHASYFSSATVSACPQVTAGEPSAEMIAQRPAGAAPAVRASAEALPFADDAFDAAMAVLTVPHWPDREAGLAEMRRGARRRVVIVTFDPGPLPGCRPVARYSTGGCPEREDHHPAATLDRDHRRAPGLRCGPPGARCPQPGTGQRV